MFAMVVKSTIQLPAFNVGFAPGAKDLVGDCEVPASQSQTFNLQVYADSQRTLQVAGIAGTNALVTVSIYLR
jgi:hypothetical protein